MRRDAGLGKLLLWLVVPATCQLIKSTLAKLDRPRNIDEVGQFHRFYSVHLLCVFHVARCISIEMALVKMSVSCSDSSTKRRRHVRWI
jgi:hypothetical protein